MQHGVDPDMYFKNEPHPLMGKFWSIWADNGNVLSIQYTGTVSTTFSITKTGKKGIFDSISSSLTSVNRFLNKTISDSFKDNCIRFLLDRKMVSIIYFNNSRY